MTDKRMDDGGDPQGAKLERQLLHAISMEKKATSRVRRSATLLHKWQKTRRRIERRIGEAEVRRIVNRLRLTEGSTNHETE